MEFIQINLSVWIHIQSQNRSLILRFPYQRHLYLKNKIEYYHLGQNRQIFCENTEQSFRCKKLNFSDLSVIKDSLSNTIKTKVVKQLEFNLNSIESKFREMYKQKKIK